MSFLKFMTICDDELLPESRHILKKYDISAYPSVYFCGDTPYIDTINTNSEFFYNDLKSGNVTSLPTVPADIFEYEFQQAYNYGYLGVIVVLPHNKWTNFKHQAEIAKKRFFRKIDIDEQGFKIKLYDSKTFSAGTVSQAVKFASLYQDSHFSAFDFADAIKHKIQTKTTYILAKDENVFDSDKGLKAYIIKNNNISRMNISQYPDSVIFDLFAKDFVDNLKNCKYNASLGYACDFAGNVLGRIEKLSESVPTSTVKYGIPTTQILGNSAVCLNYFNHSDDEILL